MLVNNFVGPAIAGLIAVIVGFASSIALIYQTVINLGGDPSLAASWVLALGLTIGLTSIALSYYYRIPILIAWSTPGAALLMANTLEVTLSEAVAGFMLSALLIVISGVTGWFEKLINRIPIQLASAMLAGLLVNFGVDVFNQMNSEPFLVIAMFMTYLIAKYIIPKFAMLLVLAVTIAVAWQLDMFASSQFVWHSAELVFIPPDFTANALFGVGIPLFIVTMAAQNLPGIAILKAHKYPTPTSSILNVTGVVNLIAAPFGCFGINLAAITAAICMSEEVNKDPKLRYWGAVAGGVFYLLMALTAGFLLTIFANLPTALILALAGIALLTTITNSIQQALSDHQLSEAAIITFLVTASDIALLELSPVLWGLIAGSLTLMIKSLLEQKETH